MGRSCTWLETSKSASFWTPDSRGSRAATHDVRTRVDRPSTPTAACSCAQLACSTLFEINACPRHFAICHALVFALMPTSQKDITFSCGSTVCSQSMPPAHGAAPTPVTVGAHNRLDRPLLLRRASETEILQSILSRTTCRTADLVQLRPCLVPSSPPTTPGSAASRCQQSNHKRRPPTTHCLDTRKPTARITTPCRVGPASSLHTRQWDLAVPCPR